MSSWHSKPLQQSILATVKKALDSPCHPGFYVNRLRESLEQIHTPANRYANRIIRLILTDFAALRPCKCGGWHRGGNERMCKKCWNALYATRTGSEFGMATSLRRKAVNRHKRELEARNEPLKRRCCVKHCIRRGFIHKTKFGPPGQIIYCCRVCWPVVRRKRESLDWFQHERPKRMREGIARQNPFKPVVPPGGAPPRRKKSGLKLF